MKISHKLILTIALTSSFILLTILFLLIFCCRRRKSRYMSWRDIESVFDSCDGIEELMRFDGGEDLSVEKVLDAPGEVVGKSSYGTLYRASLVNSSEVTLLRFLRPSCTLGVKEVVPLVELVGSIRHPCLVPLIGFYRGTKGEMLMIHPFYGNGNLAQFIKDGKNEAYKWPTIHKISIGIAKGVGHLHSKLIIHGNLKSKNVLLDHNHRPYISDFGLHLLLNPTAGKISIGIAKGVGHLHSKLIIHGNLKSKNVLLDHNHRPYISDFGLHLLLNPTAGQQMLDASASGGYRAPEIIKMKDASKESDVYSLGVIFLELLSGKLSTRVEEFHLPTAILDGLYNWEILAGLSEDEKVVTEERIFRFLQLGMACCSSSPHLRPNINQLLEKLQEIGK